MTRNYRGLFRILCEIMKYSLSCCLTQLASLSRFILGSKFRVILNVAIDVKYVHVFRRIFRRNLIVICYMIIISFNFVTHYYTIIAKRKNSTTVEQTNYCYITEIQRVLFWFLSKRERQNFPIKPKEEKSTKLPAFAIFYARDDQSKINPDLL